MNQLQAVFFDLDGTLVDTALDMGATLNQLLENHGRDTLPHKQIRPHVSNGANVLIELGFGKLNTDRLNELREEYLAIYSNNLAVHSILFDGMDKVLDKIELRNLPWGVITNKPSWLTEPLLKQLALFERCACIVSADTCSERKPHPMPMYHACKLAGVDAEHCIYVGDARRDIEAGKAAGMQTVAAGYGYTGVNDDINSWGADSIISQSVELLAWL